MPKLIVFSAPLYAGSVREYRSNDPDLTVHGHEFTFASAIVASGYWELYSEPNYAGEHISLGFEAGPDFDGTYKDFVDWGGSEEFTVRSLMHDGTY